MSVHQNNCQGCILYLTAVFVSIQFFLYKQDWFSRQQLVLVVLVVNIALAIVFFKMLTQSNRKFRVGIFYLLLCSTMHICISYPIFFLYPVFRSRPDTQYPSYIYTPYTNTFPQVTQCQNKCIHKYMVQTILQGIFFREYQ